MKNTPAPSSYGNLGLMYILGGDLDKALDFALEAYDYNDSDNAIADNLGEVYFLRGEYDKADEVYKALMERSPKTPTPYYNYGRVLAAKGDTEGAEDYFTRAQRFKFNNLTCVSREDVDRELEKLHG
jgi:tetratricopeptide (TPR) repeat protein